MALIQIDSRYVSDWIYDPVVLKDSKINPNNTVSISFVANTGTTVYWAGTASTGNRTILQRGLATIICVNTNIFVISGSLN